MGWESGPRLIVGWSAFFRAQNKASQKKSKFERAPPCAPKGIFPEFENLPPILDSELFLKFRFNYLKIIWNILRNIWRDSENNSEGYLKKSVSIWNISENISRKFLKKFLRKIWKLTFNYWIFSEKNQHLKKIWNAIRCFLKKICKSIKSTPNPVTCYSPLPSLHHARTITDP